MGRNSGNPGINKFAMVIQDRVSQNMQAGASLVLDFGSIQADYSLRTNTFQIPIPRSDYLVCRQMTLGTETSLLGSTEEGGGQYGPHRHEMRVPDKMRSIRPGDRVLVAWVQNDAVVVDIIIPADRMEE